MKSLLLSTVLLGLLATYAWSSSEYYFGDTTSYSQLKADQTKLPPGFIAIPKGTILKLAIGSLPKEPQAIISPKKSAILFKNEPIYLDGDKNSKFLSSDLVQIDKGGYIQYFKSADKGPDQLIRYNSDKLLVEIVDLIKVKKTEQGAAANP